MKFETEHDFWKEFLSESIVDQQFQNYQSKLEKKVMKKMSQLPELSTIEIDKIKELIQLFIKKKAKLAKKDYKDEFGNDPEWYDENFNPFYDEPIEFNGTKSFWCKTVLSEFVNFLNELNNDETSS